MGETFQHELRLFLAQRSISKTSTVEDTGAFYPED